MEEIRALKENAERELTESRKSDESAASTPSPETSWEQRVEIMQNALSGLHQLSTDFYAVSFNHSYQVSLKQVNE